MSTSPQTSAQRKSDFASRFFKIFNSHLFGAAKQANLPQQVHGFMYFTSEPLKSDTDGKVIKYKSAHIGRAVVLTPEQERHIAQYLGISVEELIGARKQQ